jgi:hypothetical protein
MENFEEGILEPDGSVVSASGALFEPPSPAGAAEYARRLPIANKFLNPDGSIGTAAQQGISGGGGCGGNVTSVNGQTGDVILTGADIAVSATNSEKLDEALANKADADDFGWG